MKTARTLLAMAIVLSLALSFSANAVGKGDEATRIIKEALDSYEKLTKDARENGPSFSEIYRVGPVGKIRLTTDIRGHKISYAIKIGSGLERVFVISKKENSDAGRCYSFQVFPNCEYRDIKIELLLFVDSEENLQIEPESAESRDFLVEIMKLLLVKTGE